MELSSYHHLSIDSEGNSQYKSSAPFALLLVLFRVVASISAWYPASNICSIGLKADHDIQFLAGRFLSGMGVGMMQVSVPIYQSELSPAKQRGRMVGGHGILIVCGYVSLFSVCCSASWLTSSR